MSSTPHPAGSSPVAALQRRAATAKPSASEPCEFCSVALGPNHRHLLELPGRKILCVCDPCGLRFEGAVGGRYQLIPRQAQALADFRLTDEQWAALGLPIDLAFISINSPHHQPVAFYPSPGGAIQSLLSPASWNGLVAENPCLLRLQPDIEALLVNRTGGARDYYIAPIDRCFELAGLVRCHWKGFAGGTAVWKEVHLFFDSLKGTAGRGRTTWPRETSHA